MERRKYLISPENKFLEKFKNTNVSLDVDGVIINSVNHVVGLFNKEHGKNYLPTDMREYEVVVKWLRQMGCSEEYVWKKEKEYWYSETLLGANLNLGVIPFLNFLQNANNNVYVISSRPKAIRESTIRMLQERLGLDENKILIQENSEMPGIIYKAMMVQKMGIEIHFEDMHSHAKMILDNTEGCKVVLMSNIYGSSLLEDYYQPRVYRVRNPNPFEIPNFLNVEDYFGLHI